MIKNLIIAVVGIIFASLLYIAFVPATSPFVGGPVACTQEAKLCPDGSAVGRTGPNCEFAECPSTSTVTYNCAGDRSLIATFGVSTVGLQLPDGRTFCSAKSQLMEMSVRSSPLTVRLVFGCVTTAHFFLRMG